MESEMANMKRIRIGLLIAFLMATGAGQAATATGTGEPNKTKYEFATVIKSMMFSHQADWLSFKNFVHDLKPIYEDKDATFSMKSLAKLRISEHRDRSFR
jgi:hypothetical protein